VASGAVHDKELPKSSSSRRAVEIDESDVEVLGLHRKRQLEEPLAVGAAWPDLGLVFALVFTAPRGQRIHPPTITREFHAVTDRAGLPRTRLHDLRHTHRTLLLKSGEIAKVITERLGHSTTVYTQDAYQHVLSGMQRGGFLWEIPAELRFCGGGRGIRTPETRRSTRFRGGRTRPDYAIPPGPRVRVSRRVRSSPLGRQPSDDH